MSNRVSVIINGVTYPTISDACRAYGISRFIVSNRIHSLGWDTETAITTPVQHNGTKVVLDGVEYNSLSDLSRDYGINYYTMIHRLKNGMTLEEAVTTPVRYITINHGTPVTIDGIDYKSITDAAIVYGIDRFAVYSRLIHGWSLEDALKTPVGKSRTISNK